MKKLFIKIIFGIGITLAVLFFMWSKLFVVSVLLFIVIDSFSIAYISKLLKKYVKSQIYKIIKFGYIICLPIIIAIFFRTFLFDVYYVPSSSMERTLFPGDYVLVNKLSYGVKIPKQYRNIPVIGQFFDSKENEFDLYTSLKAFKKFQREDIVVFKAVDGSDKFLIKRIIGMPADTLQIKQTKTFINSLELTEKETYTYKYIQQRNKNEVSILNGYSNAEYEKLSNRERKLLKKDIKVQINYNYFLFPSSKQEIWTRDNYGSLIIPKKGMKISLTKENIEIYNSVTIKFEKTDLTSYKYSFYTFKNNYYFMMGDNRHNSLDSRSFGFVPESLIQGKMIKAFSKKRLLKN